MVKRILTHNRHSIRNRELFNEAKKFIPGGVNSPVRSFKTIGGIPIFIKEGKGSKIYGECSRPRRSFGADGEFARHLRAENGFIDYCLAFGALILGHAHPKITAALQKAIKNGTCFGTVTKLETELAKLIVKALPSIEQVRLTSSGTEAVMSAVRLARAYTKKNKIIKFEGAYHGHADYLLVKAGSGALTLGLPDSEGVSANFAKDTIPLPFNDIKIFGSAVKKYKKDLAAIIVEPVMANCGLILPRYDFLRELRKVADRHNVVLIFDEVITGFRLSYNGAQGYFNVKPDLTCLGKVIGGGMPVGAFGGKREIMQLLAPQGGVYQAGTLSGNPIAVTAGVVTLNILKENNIYETMREKTLRLCEGIKVEAEKYKIKLRINYIGSMFSIFFTDEDIIDLKSAKTQDTGLFKKFFHGLLKRGVYFSPSGFETDFLSTAHTTVDREKTLEAIGKVFEGLRRR